MKPPSDTILPVAMFSIFLWTAVSSPAAPSLGQDLDFAALTNGGHATLIHIDGKGKVVQQPIDFLKGEIFDTWDVVSLDQLATATLVGKPADKSFEVRYYKTGILFKTFRLGDTRIVSWMLLLPERNCLILSTSPGSSLQRLVRIDLKSGEQKSVDIDNMSGLDFKPISETVNGKIIVVETGGFSPSPGPLFDSLAHLDPDDLTIKDRVKFSGIEVDGLLFADPSGQHVTAYGAIGGGEPHMLPRSGTAGLIDMDMKSGKSTMIMADVSSGAFQYLHFGIAAINHRFVVMSKVPGSPFDLGGYRTYCVDLLQKGVFQLSGISAIVYPNSHNGFLLSNVSPVSPKKSPGSN